MFKLKWMLVFCLTVVSLAVLVYRGVAQPDPAASLRPDIAQLLEQANANGYVAVIVELDQPGFDPALAAEETVQSDAQSRNIAQTQDQVLDRLDGRNIRGVTRYDYIPFLALQVDAVALQALQADPAVTNIVADISFEPYLDRSLLQTRAEGAHSLGYRGAGTAIAVLDSGFDKNHPDLSGKVVSEACYSTTDPAEARFSVCPNGQNSQTGNGSAAVPSAIFSGYDHGTHVAAIAAGVAPDTKIVAMQVFARVYENAAKQCTSYGRRSPCLLARQSDYLKGLERVIALRSTYNIVAVNMSLGAGSYVSACDNNAQFTSIRLLVDTLRSVGVVTVAAAGNSSYRNSMGAPACLSSIVSVGATSTYPDNLIDKVADFSNIGFGTTLLAPGTPIEAAVPRTLTDCGEGTAPVDNRCFKGGTSMAAPHVAGAVAVLRAAKPTATTSQIISALSGTGPIVSDQRPGGTISRRRLDVYGALCSLVPCDIDDFRILTLNQTLTGNIASGDSQDVYYFNGAANQRIVVSMSRLNGSVDPFLSVWDPDGNLIAVNDNGGGGVNSRVNLLILPRFGRYMIIADSSSSNLTGGYQINVTQGSSTQNPTPFVRLLQPSSATAGSAGFWAAINGSNFLNSSVTRLNGANRPTFYSSSELIWIWLYPSDLSSVTGHYIDVVNPAPGNASGSLYFSVTAAFNGESRLLAPEQLSAPADEKVTFAVEWTHPSDSWRNMQNMDVRLTDDLAGDPMWLRLTEGNPESTLYLLNSAGEPLYSTPLLSDQLGSAEDWVVEGVMTLHLGETKFFGSGQTIVISPTVTFSPEVAGAYDIRFAVDDDAEESEVQNADVLGRFTILPAGCPVVPLEVSISGPPTGTTGVDHTYYATVSPPGATQPITWTWFPEPASGQGTAVATYNWAAAGQQPVGVIAENCADFVSNIETIPVYTTDAPDLSLSKTAAAIALPGEIITYTLSLTNSGANPATGITITDLVPVGATYVSGGNLSADMVNWSVGNLDGFGATAQVTYTVTAETTIINDTYTALTDGGYSATGDPAVTTRIVGAMEDAEPLEARELRYESADVITSVMFPAGAVFAPTTIAYEELGEPLDLPSGMRFAGRAFRLDAYQGNAPVPDYEPGEPLPTTLTFREEDVAGLDTTLLTLYRRTDSTWTAEGITCQTDAASRAVTCSVFAPLGEFALVVADPPRMLFLPMMVFQE